MVQVVFFYVLRDPLLCTGMVLALIVQGLHFGLPAALLAGVLERPFIGKNGPGRHVVWYAIQANLMTMLLMYLGVWVAMKLLYPARLLSQLGFWGDILPFLFIVLVEYCYLALRGVIGWRKWWRIVLGNYFSGFVISLVTIALFMWYQELPSLRAGRLHAFLMVFTWASGITGCLLAFWVPWRSKRRVGVEQVTESAPPTPV